MTSTDKQSYQAPAIAVIGSFEEVTQAGHPLGKFDANYGVGTPVPPGGAGNLS